MAGGTEAEPKLSRRARRRNRVLEELSAIDRAKAPTALGVVGKFIAYPAIFAAIISFATDHAVWGVLASLVALVSTGLFVAGSAMLARRGGLNFTRGLWIVWGIPTWSAISDVVDLF